MIFEDKYFVLDEKFYENDEKLKKMRIRLKPLKKPNAAEEIIASLDIWRN